MLGLLFLFYEYLLLLLYMIYFSITLIIQCITKEGEVMDITLINQYLKEGKTVKEIRNILGYSEKSYQNEIKKLGYKYNQKIKQYVLQNVEVMPVDHSNSNSNTSSNTTCITPNNINLISKAQEQSINFISENIQELQEIIMYYKRNKESNTNNHGIVIDLIDDKHMKNENPKSVRVNYFIWNEWKEFTDKSSFSSKDLISMALKEYMNKYK